MLRASRSITVVENSEEMELLLLSLVEDNMLEEHKSLPERIDDDDGDDDGTMTYLLSFLDLSGWDEALRICTPFGNMVRTGPLLIRFPRMLRLF